MSRVLMLFLDGVGIGKEESNPLFSGTFPAVKRLCGGQIPSDRHLRSSTTEASYIPLDANLGVEGLPQSGTGQTALFTGINGAAHIGKHFGPHPYSSLKPILREHNIFQQLLDRGKSVCFANAFPQRFFDYVGAGRSKLTVTTFSCLASGIPLMKNHDLEQGRGVSADITGAAWGSLGYPNIPAISPRTAGERLATLSRTHDFVLFEYWETDHAGHAQDMHRSVEVLEKFDSMLDGILTSLDPSETLLVITSDHGNIEDLSSRTHTRNPVPLILYGHRHREIAVQISGADSKGGDLTHVTPHLVSFLTGVSETPP